MTVCSKRPGILIEAPRDADVGPLQALIDELEFNTVVAGEYGCLFLDNEFRRAIREGAIATVDEGLKKAILAAYVAIGTANRDLSTLTPGFTATINKSIQAAKPEIEKAREALLQFLSSEN